MGCLGHPQLALRVILQRYSQRGLQCITQGKKCKSINLAASLVLRWTKFTINYFLLLIQFNNIFKLYSSNIHIHYRIETQNTTLIFLISNTKHKTIVINSDKHLILHLLKGVWHDMLYVLIHNPTFNLFVCFINEHSFPLVKHCKLFYSV